MEFQPLSLCCECGLPPLRLKQVGLTSQHQIAIVWWCNGCKRNVVLLKDLADCWRECPPAETAEAVSQISSAKAQESDTDFLRSLGVRFPDAAE